VPLIGLEPIRSYPSRDFKSLASACSATTAKILEAPSRFELENKGFADLCLTTWLWCLKVERETGFEPATFALARQRSSH
jgi:hypothetical protein